MTMIIRDIEVCRQLQVEGIVVGMLTADGEIDEKQLQRVVDAARQGSHMLRVCFHRAFDMSLCPFRSLDILIRHGIEIVLTSGQQTTAAAGISLLQRLSEVAGGRIHVMAGAGITAENAFLFAAAGLTSIHGSFSCSKASSMRFRFHAI